MKTTLVGQEPQKTFSKAACCYEQYSSLQQDIGEKLLKALPAEDHRLILDVGMGTGWLTEKIAERFRPAKVIGIDCAFGMVAQARKKNIHAALQADAQALPFHSDRFDLVVSNCAYQWVEDMPKAFCEAARVLAPRRNFYFSCFGSKTLCELREAIQKSAPAAESALHHWHLLTRGHIHQALREAGFSTSQVTCELRTERFDTMWALIAWLKTIGANRVKRNMFIGAQLLSQANIYYQQHFPLREGISVTFEIMWGTAHK